MKSVAVLFTIFVTVQFSEQAAVPMTCLGPDGSPVACELGVNECGTITDTRDGSMLSRGCIQETLCNYHTTNAARTKAAVEAMTQSQRNLLEVFMAGILDALGTKPDGTKWKVDDLANSQCESCSTSKCNTGNELTA